VYRWIECLFVVVGAARISAAATVATDEPPLAADATAAATVATDEPSASPPGPVVVRPSRDDDPPHEIVLGRLLVEPYRVSVLGGGRHGGGRIGIDMVAANGEQATRLAGGIRLMLGGDSALAFGPEGQFLIGIARTIGSRAVVALVAPLGFTINGDFTLHGYAGLEGVGAVGPVEVAAGLSNRGARVRIGFVRAGKDAGFGLGLDWQRDRDGELVGIYLASTPGRPH